MDSPPPGNAKPTGPTPDPDEPQRRPNPWLPTGWVILVIVGVLGLVFLTPQLFDLSREISYSRFEKLAADGDLKKVTFLGREKLSGEVRDPTDEKLEDLKLSEEGRFTVRLPSSDNQLEFARLIQEGYQRHFDRRLQATGKSAEELREELPPVEIRREEEPGAWLGPAMLALLPVLLILGIFLFFFLPRMRDPSGGFINNYVKSPAKRYERGTEGRITFDDVAGMGSAKSELREIVDFLKSPEKFEKLGARVPKGVLLVGPPGTGKTLMARAVAGEAGVPFFSVSGSEFIQMFVGVGASRVRDLFKTAKENSPCLMFIDEIDAVGRMRGAGVGGGSDEREQTLNQILSEMDGFSPTETVIVLAATNRPDVLDSALLRPGRFDRHVTVDRANWQGRLAILQVHTRNKPLAEDVDLELIARKMIGMTGADLANLCNEAALQAARDDANRIRQKHFEAAADRVMIGPKREEVLTPEDKKKTAYHEAGHALVCWKEPGADKPLKVSIIPRGRSLGVNVIIPEEERYHYGFSYFKAKLVMTMGGRAADRLVFGEANAGAEQDLKQATNMARHMVARWGMSERLGPVALRIGEEHVFLGKEIQEARDFSEGTAAIVDQEVQRLLREADERAEEILRENREDLDRVASELLNREELTREQLDEILGEGTPGSEASTEAAAVGEPGA